ncbi:hypothetical protein ABPG72_009286 [Tetrahymena utriculariae]
MGNRQYDSDDLSKDKRDWVSFFIGLQQGKEVLIIFNIFYIILFNRLIILPLVMGIIVVFKKWWMIVFDHRLIDQSSEQDFCLTLIGVTPTVITEYFVFFREIELFIHHISCLMQIYYFIMYSNDCLNFLFTILLGFFADSCLFNQKKYFKYKRNLIILLQSTEIALGSFLSLASIILCFKSYLVGFSFLLFIIIETYFFTKKYGTSFLDELIISQIGGFHQIKLRDKCLSRICNNKEISYERIFPFISICQISVILCIDLYFYNQEELKSLRYIMYSCFLLYVPSITQIVKYWIKFIKYGTHIKDILIHPEDIQNHNNQEALQKYTTFQKHQININYFIYKCQYDFIYQLFNIILTDD